MVLILTGCTSQGTETVLLDMQDSETSSYATGGISDMEYREEAAKAPSEEKPLVVYVCGAVNAPGVYELEAGGRINDAIKAAGGFSADADETYVNLAAPLSDGIRLVIPTREETSGNTPKDMQNEVASFDDPIASGSKEGLVDINSASLEELKTLPGIGESIASRIISYREKNGRFSRIEDIMKVSGIKKKLFSKIQDKITAG